MIIRAVVFDFDGTLVDSNHIKRETFFETAKMLGEIGDVVENVLATNHGDRTAVFAQIIQILSDRGTLPSHHQEGEWVDVLVDQFTSRCEQAISSCLEIEGANELLNNLSQRKIPLFINSSTPTETLIRIIKQRGMEGYFKGIYGGPETKIDNMKIIQEKVNAKPDEILFIGDSKLDQSAALEARCHFIGVSSTEIFDPSIKNLKEFISLIAKLEASKGLTFLNRHQS